VFESGRYTKTELNWRPFTSAVCASMAGSPGPSLPQKKIEFGIVGDAIPAVWRG